MCGARGELESSSAVGTDSGLECHVLELWLLAAIMVLDECQGHVAWLFGDDVVQHDYREHLDCWCASKQRKLNRGWGQDHPWGGKQSWSSFVPSLNTGIG